MIYLYPIKKMTFIKLPKFLKKQPLKKQMRMIPNLQAMKMFSVKLRIYLN